MYVPTAKEALTPMRLSFPRPQVVEAVTCGNSTYYRLRHHRWQMISAGVVTKRPFDVGLINLFLSDVHRARDQVLMDSIGDSSSYDDSRQKQKTATEAAL